ncbi:hypothetical protein SteCoe_34380 [Stentor coeruleus]|uniref:Uncharacterized protein n=1 Tax=Stentor coeruleus TaxID=5963 RepID=A0A1R2AUM8_9CILI|nr:hypothetical protein SteCoe_34380 [Stentor coeruleus]
MKLAVKHIEFRFGKDENFPIQQAKRAHRKSVHSAMNSTFNSSQMVIQDKTLNLIIKSLKPRQPIDKSFDFNKKPVIIKQENFGPKTQDGLSKIENLHGNSIEVYDGKIIDVSCKEKEVDQKKLRKKIVVESVFKDLPLKVNFRYRPCSAKARFKKTEKRHSRICSFYESVYYRFNTTQSPK